MLGDHAALLVDDEHGRLPVRAQALRALSSRVDDRRPGPLVLSDELACAVRRVGDVEAEVLELRVILGELREGDRLAVADQSPR
jgi:hypothetical protein